MEMLHHGSQPHLRHKELVKSKDVLSLRKYSSDPHLLFLELDLELGNNLHLDPGLGRGLVAEAVLLAHVLPPDPGTPALPLTARPPALAPGVEQVLPLPAQILVKLRLKAGGCLLAAARPV